MVPIEKICRYLNRIGHSTLQAVLSALMLGLDGSARAPFFFVVAGTRVSIRRSGPHRIRRPAARYNKLDPPHTELGVVLYVFVVTFNHHHTCHVQPHHSLKYERIFPALIKLENPVDTGSS